MTVVDAPAFDCDCELSFSAAETQGIPLGRCLHGGGGGGGGRGRERED